MSKKITKAKVAGVPIIFLGVGAIALVGFHLYGKARVRQAARARALRRAYAGRAQLMGRRRW